MQKIRQNALADNEKDAQNYKAVEEEMQINDDEVD